MFIQNNKLSNKYYLCENIFSNFRKAFGNDKLKNEFDLESRGDNDVIISQEINYANINLSILEKWIYKSSIQIDSFDCCKRKLQFVINKKYLTELLMVSL